MGYKIVQISGTPLKASDMKPILDKYGLEVVLTHGQWKDFRENLEDVIEYNKTLGSELCGLGMMPFEFSKLDGKYVMDRLVEETAPFECMKTSYEFLKTKGFC